MSGIGWSKRKVCILLRVGIEYSSCGGAVTTMDKCLEPVDPSKVSKFHL